MDGMVVGLWFLVLGFWSWFLVFVLGALYFVLCTLYVPGCHSSSIKQSKYKAPSTKLKPQTSNLPIEFSRTVARNTQTLPIRGAKMFREKNYLTNVVVIL